MNAIARQKFELTTMMLQSSTLATRPLEHLNSTEYNIMIMVVSVRIGDFGTVPKEEKQDGMN